MKIAAVIPCFRVRRHIINVVEQALSYVDIIYVIDDSCPEYSGNLVAQNFSSPKVKVIHLPSNEGVGGAVMAGYREAISDGIDIVVKLDGDGQMSPQNIPYLIYPIITGVADYTKGNRFYQINYLRTMPPIRVFGNSVLSLVNKISSGYWNVMDPTNGFIAIHATALKTLDFNKISKRYFFESDMLFRLNISRAVVKDVPLPAIYADEESNLRISSVVTEFPQRYILNFFKRFFYNYVLRDMNIGTIETLVGSAMLFAGIVFGFTTWINSSVLGISTPVGTVMLAVLPIILGSQLLLAAIGYDIYNIPNQPIQKIVVVDFGLNSSSSDTNQ